MKQPTDDTICGQPIVYDFDLPEGEIHMHPFTMALLEAKAPSVTLIQKEEPKP